VGGSGRAWRHGGGRGREGGGSAHRPWWKGIWGWELIPVSTELVKVLMASPRHAPRRLEGGRVPRLVLSPCVLFLTSRLSHYLS
jgi:hypothetical protein